MKAALFGLATALLLAVPAAAAPVLMISVDGLRPADVIEAEKRGVAVPTLKAIMAKGAYAEAVIGVTPTLTYPSHTTLITGAAPARHGIGNNQTFDPLNINQVGWTWYAADIEVPTLWSAARAAGLKTVNVHWPVSVGAPIDWNLPQIWRTGHDDDRKLMRALATPGCSSGWSRSSASMRRASTKASRRTRIASASPPL
jgi:predicted AlkP superfamily pyrophosphatase or phosphodiesterase